MLGIDGAKTANTIGLLPITRGKYPKGNINAMTIDILTVTDLKKYFVIGHSGILKREPITVKAVDGISFTVREGETFGLVGESGSGKSTVAYTTIGMYRPTAGGISYRGQNLFEGNKARPLGLKKEIQIVFQDPGSSFTAGRRIGRSRSSGCWRWSSCRRITCTSIPRC
jgi:ABC-type oligopeptide transport system ATPase subunit